MNIQQKHDTRRTIRQLLRGTGMLGVGLLLIAILGYTIYAMMGGLQP